MLLLQQGLWGRISFSSGLVHRLKQLMGFIILGAGLFFAQRLFPKAVLEAGWMALALAFGAWCIVWAASGERKKLRPVLMLALAMVVFSAWREGAFFSSAEGIQWQAYSETALANAQADGQRVIIGFMADWCPSCQDMKRTTLRSQKLVDKIGSSDIAVLLVDLTRPDAPSQRLFERFGGHGVPYLVFLDNRGKVHRRVTGAVGADTIIGAIDAMRLGQ